MKISDRIKNDFGRRIRELRLLKGLSQEDFSFKCGLDRTYISQVELGKRNICLQNIKVMADALQVSTADLFSQYDSDTLSGTEFKPSYRVKDNVSIKCGFTVSSNDILESSNTTAKQLQMLPFLLYQNIDLKTLSSIVGALFAGSLAARVGAIVNPIEKGHPDIVPLEAHNATETQLRNYPEGLEIKTTVGNVSKKSNLHPGISRVSRLTGITWQAHHREVNSLLGLVIDFAGAVFNGKQCPLITGVFYSNALTFEDWGEISGTTGRNTKVTGMRLTGRNKMGSGWLLLLDSQEYIVNYSHFLKFVLD